MSSTLLSGFLGSLLMFVFGCVASWYKSLLKRKNLYRAIGAECVYNLGILDQVTDGVVKHNGTFKRMSIEFFKTMRQQSIDYGCRPRLLRALSWLIVDLELFNLEIDYCFGGKSEARSFVGVIGTQAVCVESQLRTKDISGTVKNANKGVRGSLENVLRIVAKELHEDEEMWLKGTFDEEEEE